MREMYVKSSEAFLLVFSITSRSSFDELDRHYALIHRVKAESDSPLRMILCGNKCDLEDSREVSSAEAIAKANQWGIDYYETSAKTRHNVEEVFYNSIRSIRGPRVSRFKLVQGNETMIKFRKNFIDFNHQFRSGTACLFSTAIFAQEQFITITA
jgi:GTPase SAR1 family protein